MEATATTEEKVDGSKDRVGDAVQRHQGTNNGRATLGLRIGELHGDRDKRWKDWASVGAKDPEDDIVPSHAEFQAG